MSREYLRKASLVVGVGADGLDLSELHFKFSVRAGSLQTPNTATIRVYNLADATAQQIQKEFTRVILQAGYEGNDVGTLFDGTIVQIRRGREDATDTYLDIIAADGDEAINFAIVSVALTAGSTFRDRVEALAQAMKLPLGHIADLPPSKLPRGKTLYGMGRDHLRDVALGTDMEWSVQQGQLQMIPINGYLPGEAVVLTANSGLIGQPQQMVDGIHVKCLINPRIRPGGRIQIDNKSIQQAHLDLNLSGGAVASNAFLPRITDDGFYRVVIIEHEGNTRGQDWYSDIICVALGDAAQGLIARGYS